DERHLNDLRRLLARGTLITTESTDYEEAAALYRVCRRNGATVRKMIDCLIASIAIRSGTALLHSDTDFDVLARHTPLEIDRVRS
ncbi:MAG TPA: PIN domain-containing protein, partial [Acidimicrobiales bacterium]|nr:PIN domain-containing protein [Acidimicrobiales bacterium]